MAIANAIQNATKVGQVITWQDADGDPLPLTGSTLSGFITDPLTGVTKAIAGSLGFVTDGSDGVFTWAYGNTDVDTPGRFIVQFVATYGDTREAKSRPIEWYVYKGYTVS